MPAHCGQTEASASSALMSNEISCVFLRAFLCSTAPLKSPPKASTLPFPPPFIEQQCSSGPVNETFWNWENIEQPNYGILIISKIDKK